MAAQHVFISHSSKDDGVVAAIRLALEGLDRSVWVDSRRLTAGDKLDREIRAAIDGARHFVAVLSPRAVNSRWVTKEIQFALKVQKKRTDGFKVIPVLLDGIEPAALDHWFGAEPVAIQIPVGPGGISAALPDLLAALGERLPTDAAPPEERDTTPIADLILELTEPALDTTGGKHRATAIAQLTYNPPDGTPDVESRRYHFTAPLGPIEAEDLRWYLERYCHWPSGVFQERAKEIEAKLPEWGKSLFAAMNADSAREAFAAWNAARRDVTRRFTVLVNSELVEGSTPEQKDAAAEAATLLLSLPWELIHDDQGYLFQGARGVRVRRRLPNHIAKDPLKTDPPIRVLLVSPRPEDERASYIDHRISARPLVEALAPLGELAELTLLNPPTFQALQDELQRAYDAERPYHVVHFDGHGVYDRRHGLGALCFEDEADAKKLDKRRSKTIDADALAQVMRSHRVPLFFLEACQSAMADKDPTASVAGRLLQGGVASVVAMSHTVLVETARRFVAPFYLALMDGQRIGQAMLAGQLALKADTFRGKVFQGELHLQDWFVPVLFQEEIDPQLITRVPAEQVRAITSKHRTLALGNLPGEPGHTFVGRSRELLRAERLLEQVPYVVLRGEGGEGKTTLAAELARWLVATGRYRRAAFVSLENAGDARTVLYALGDQLVPGFPSEARGDDVRALQLVERALADRPTLLVLDNMESVLPPAPDSAAAEAFEPEVLARILDLATRLGRIGRTRLIVTSREAIPAPFERNHVTIDRLDRPDAIALVGRVLGEGNLMPHAADAGASDVEVEALVDAVGCHGRSLVLLAGEVVASGVRHATQHLHELMAALQQKHPDDRERSLLASVELSLRRLPVAIRQRLGPLGVFQGGGHLGVIAMVLELDTEKDEEVALAQQLIGVGLAEMLPYNYLRLNPALGPALLRGFDAAQRETALDAWAEAMVQLAEYLDRQRDKDAQFAATLTLLELPNLLAGLEQLCRTADAERVIAIATAIERLVANLGRPRARARAAAIQADVAKRLGEWSHARYLNESAAVNRLMESGRHSKAVAAARALLTRAQTAGETAFAEAAYDLAMCHFRLGRALMWGGDSGTALAPLAEARVRFQKLADAGIDAAIRMASVTIMERADCLQDLGRLDESAAAYEEAIKLSRARGDTRQVAVGKGQLGTVQMLQHKYDEALAVYTEVRETFETLGEPSSVASAWHQIGMVHRAAGQYEAAERAYQESLKIEVQIGNRPGEATTLGELGNLYDAMNRREEAARFYRQAADLYVDDGNLAKEGLVRSNIANTLITLQRHAEARQELLRAIECEIPFGHAAEPWKTLAILCDLERAVGNPAAAAEARRRAVQAYLDYRRDGGENHTTGGRMSDLVAQAIRAGSIDAAAAQLVQWLQRPDLPDSLRALIPAFQVVLSGSRDAALADDPNLDFNGEAELRLLLESLGPPPQPPPRAPAGRETRARRRWRWPWQRR